MAPKPTAVHLTVRPNAHGSRPPGVALHYRQLGDREVVRFGAGLSATTPARTVVDCAATMSFSDALGIADSALNTGRSTSDDLVAAAASYRGHGSAKARRVVELATGLAANPFESAMRAICVEHGFRDFRPQLKVPHDRGYYLLDPADERRMLALESDGFQFHGDRRKFHADLTRQNELICRGWLVLRFSWEHVMLNADWVARVISDTLHLRRVRPGRKNDGSETRIAA